jgi:hypothetical protein
MGVGVGVGGAFSAGRPAEGPDGDGVDMTMGQQKQG